MWGVCPCNPLNAPQQAWSVPSMPESPKSKDGECELTSWMLLSCKNSNNKKSTPTKKKIKPHHTKLRPPNATRKRPKLPSALFKRSSALPPQESSKRFPHFAFSHVVRWLAVQQTQSFFLKSTEESPKHPLATLRGRSPVWCGFIFFRGGGGPYSLAGSTAFQSCTKFSKNTAERCRILPR